MAKPPAGRPAGVPQPYLRHGSKQWQVKVKVPAGAGGPGQIARSLGTTDRAEAHRRAPLVVAEIRREIEARRRNADGTRKDQIGDPTADQRKMAMWWAERRVPDPVLPGRFVIPEALAATWDATVDDILGEPTNRNEGHSSPRYDPKREAVARDLVERTTGIRAASAAELDRYIVQQGLTASYQSRTRSAVTRLATWLDARPSGDNIHAVSGRTADAFADHLADGEITTATVNSLVSALSAYWDWMLRRQVVAANPWKGQQRRVVARDLNAEKRPFTDSEVKSMLSGPASLTLHDMMRLAALTGMRLNEIGSLRVSDVSASAFSIREGKTASAKRDVPIHPDLKLLVTRRTKGKAPDAFLIEELTAPPSRQSRRGGKVGERFTAYRRTLKMDERHAGRRQSNADFHSWRRWFVTAAERAGNAEPIIRAVVGHKRDGVTLGTYSGGPSFEQKRILVESVRLPEGAPSESPNLGINGPPSLGRG